MCATVLVASHSATVSAAPTESERFTLRWDAPAACPDALAAETALRAQLRGPPPAGAADVAIIHDARGFVATIAIAGEAPFATRELVADECAAVARASVLVLAVAIDPVMVADVLEVDEIPPPPPPLLDELEDAPPAAIDGGGRAAVPARPRAATPWSHRLRIGGGVGSQATGTIHGAVQLGYAAIRRLARIELLATWGSPRTLRYPDGAGVRVQSLGVAARGCIAPGVGRLAEPVCLGPEGGPAVGRGRSVPRRTTATTGWLAAELGVGAIVRVASRVGIVIAADAQVAVLRPAFHLGERAEVVDAPQVGGRATLGVEVRLR